MKNHPRLRKFLLIVLLLVLAAGLVVLGINGYVKHRASAWILTAEEAVSLEDMDCILVLGCGVRPNGEPSLMLQDRLNRVLRPSR